MAHKVASWRTEPWLISREEEKTELTREQQVVRANLPSHLGQGFLADSKARMLVKIKEIITRLPLNILLIIILQLRIDELVFLEVLGMAEKVHACLKTYPIQIYNSWKEDLYRMPGPPLDLSNLRDDCLPKIKSPIKFLNAACKADLDRGPLYSKLQVDSMLSTLSAFNPVHPIVGLAINNRFTYYIFSTDAQVHRPTPNSYCNNSHLKYIFDFPHARIDLVSWSPNGELLAILTTPPDKLAIEFSYTINLAKYHPSSGIVREYTLSMRNTVLTNSRFATSNLWSSNYGLTFVGEKGKDFRKCVIDPEFDEMREWQVSPTEGLLSYTDNLGQNPTQKLGKKNEVGTMSVSPHYPADTAAFIVVCGRHPDDHHHHSLVFYNYRTNVAIRKMDQPGFVRSIALTDLHTLLLVQQNLRCHYYDVTPSDPSSCNMDDWYESVKSPLGDLTVRGHVIGINHEDLSSERLSVHDDFTISHLHRDSIYDDILQKGSCTNDFKRQLLQTNLNRELQACDDYALISLNLYCRLKRYLKLCFATGSVKSLDICYNPPGKNFGQATVSKCGFLTLIEHSGMWGKPLIYYSPFMPRKLAPKNFNCFTKLFFEKPLPLKKT
jgi:hypothetical protein